MIYNTLLEMLVSTQKVKDIEILSQDIKKNHEVYSPKIDDSLYMYHSVSEGVSDFCSALIVMPDKKVYGMFSWNLYTKENLSNISELYEQVKKIQFNDGI